MALKTYKPSRENAPYVLPSDNQELITFISKYKVDMTEQVVSSIDIALKKKLPIIEVFRFKGSQFVVTISPKEFEMNLQNIYKYYLDTEKYELCKRVAKLCDKLQNKTNEKKKKSTTGSQ